MRIGIVGHFVNGSFSSNLAEDLNSWLGQTVYMFPIHIYPEEYKFRWDKGHPDKRFPLSKIIEGADLEYIIVVQGCLDIHNDIDIPVLYFHRETERGFAIDRFTHIALKYPSMLMQLDIKCIKNKFLLLPATNPNRWKSDKPKDLFIADITKEASMQDYKDLMQRSQHILIHNTKTKYFKKQGVSMRAIEALACKAIPILFVDGFEQDYIAMGFNESNCYFNELPKYYDKKKQEAGYELLKQHTVLKRAKQILEVINNG